jgi:hypothetical protein
MRAIVVAFAAFAACLPISKQSLASVAATDSQPRASKAVVVDGRLRSAFLLRAFGGDWPTAPKNSTDTRRSLQRHFDAVLQILKSNEQLSLDRAVARLQASRQVDFSAAEAAEWRELLAARRHRHINVLQRYRDRGQFPLNEGHAQHAVPIFIDDHDTACAVGHLMRESGWGEQARAIADTVLLAYVPDAQQSPLNDWVLQSGLTLEEAALIQPGYPPPVTHRYPELSTGSFVELSGLRLENFILRPLSPNLSLDTFGVALLDGPYNGGVEIDLDSDLSHLLYLQFGSSHQFEALKNRSGFGFAAIEFDAVVTDPSKWLKGGGISMQQWYNSGRPQEVGASLDVGAGWRDASNNLQAITSLGKVRNPGESSYLFGSDIKEFEGFRRMRVSAYVEMRGEAAIDSVNLEFNVVSVPEPRSFSCIGVGLAAIMLVMNRTKRNATVA